MVIDTSERAAILETISSATTDDTTLQEAKTKLIMEITHEINETKSLDELNLIRKNLMSIRPTLNAFRAQVSSLPSTSTSRIPSNKLIVPQRRLFSTKRKKKSKKHSFNKPSAEEANIIAAEIILQNRT